MSQAALNRASYYRWQARQTAPPSVRTQRHRQLTAAIVARFATAHERVGRRPMRQLLAEDGIPCAPGTVHRIMAEQGLVARRRQARFDPGGGTAEIDPPARQNR